MNIKSKILRGVLSISASALLFFLSLKAWSLGTKFSDLSILALLPLTFFIFHVSWRVSFDTWRMHYYIVVRKNSKYYNVFNGKLRATAVAAFYTLTTIPLMAWQFLSASYYEFLTLMMCVLLAGISYIFIAGYTKNHLHSPYDQIVAIKIATWFAAICCFWSFWYVAWFIESHDMDYFKWSLGEAIVYGAPQSPNKNSILSPIFSLLFAFDAFKLWVTVQLKEYPFFPMLLSIDIALISVLLARISVIIVHFVETIVWNRR